MISVVIPTWNQRPLLEICLKSLAVQTRPADEIIVVDNGSTDGTAEWIQSVYPQINALPLDKNYGFAVAINRGIERANGDLIALLNNDAEADPAWLEELEKAAQKNSGIESFASKMLFADQRNVIQSCGIGLNPVTLEPYNLGCGEPDGPPWTQPRPVLGASAGAAMFRRAFFSEAGFFDEDFVSYYEDVDLALRGCLLRMRCLFVPAAKVYHIWQATSRGLGTRIHLCKYRNHSLVWLKNLPGSLMRRFSAGLLRFETRWFLDYLLSRYFFVPFWAWADLAIRSHHWMAKRKNIQLHRRIADADFIQLLSLQP